MQYPAPLAGMRLTSKNLPLFYMYYRAKLGSYASNGASIKGEDFGSLWSPVHLGKMARSTHKNLYFPVTGYVIA